MTERSTFYRKLGYLGAMVLLAFPIVWLSMPATSTRAGGKLAQLRGEYKLSQVNLGEVDPASETIKLATLGLRGVAVNVLWEKANHYKKTEDWTNLTATLEQLAKLQPNFITFWKFQAWNLTYNVSVEFDDYHDRYYYVRRGIQFLQQGERYNVGHPQLLWDLGWFIGQKIGRADEYLQYRRLFRDDDEYHPTDATSDQRDNWLVGKEWYKKAIDSVDNQGRSLGRKSPRDFYSSVAKSQMNYAEAIEEEGAFEKARLAWIQAAKEWREFGEHVIEHSTGVKLRLGAQTELEKELADLRAKLETLLPGTRAKLLEEKKAALTAEEQGVLALPKEQLSPQQAEQRYRLDEKIVVTDRAVAERVAREKPDDKNQALQFASEIERQDRELQYTINYKRDANYDFWLTRADSEQTPDALAARKLMFDAHKAFRAADLPTAKKLYQEGFAKWRALVDKFPAILDEDQTSGGDIVDFIKRYRKVLDQLDEQLDDSFPLWDVLEQFDRESEFTAELKDYRLRHGRPLPEDLKKETEAGQEAEGKEDVDTSKEEEPAKGEKSGKSSAISIHSKSRTA
ncbi:MAG: hypothetical protein IT425_04440 [Pirellulales bacterium]|nr:hypothetical protein [Pirellulales bacterium]